MEAVWGTVSLAASAGSLAWLRKIDRKTDYSINNLVNGQAELLTHLLDAGRPYGQVHPKLVASLTTTVDRLNSVHYAIQSILLQTIRPQRITLYISDHLGDGDIPFNLNNLRRFGLDIRFVADVGPHTKLIYALSNDPDQLIVTFDDDFYYPPNAIECLIKANTHWPKAIACNWAREICFDWRGRVKGIKQGRLLTPTSLVSNVEQKPHTARPSPLVFPYGTGAILYPPGSLDERVQDVTTFQTLCPTEDDVWFKAMALLAGTRAVPTNLGIKPRHHCVRGSQTSALRHINYKDNRNRDQLRAVFDAFDLYGFVKIRTR